MLPQDITTGGGGVWLLREQVLWTVSLRQQATKTKTKQKKSLSGLLLFIYLILLSPNDVANLNKEREICSFGPRKSTFSARKADRLCVWFGSSQKGTPPIRQKLSNYTECNSVCWQRLSLLWPESLSVHKHNISVLSSSSFHISGRRWRCLNKAGFKWNPAFPRSFCMFLPPCPKSVNTSAAAEVESGSTPCRTTL